MKVVLPEKLHQEICDHSVADFPNEACGLLVGQKNEKGELVVSNCLQAMNVSSTPEHAFEIDPTQIIKTQKNRRDLSEQIIGHYHSHPNGRAEPSKTDLKQNYDTSLIWLIAALENSKVIEINGYASFEGLFQKIDMEIISSQE